MCNFLFLLLLLKHHWWAAEDTHKTNLQKPDCELVLPAEFSQQQPSCGIAAALHFAAQTNTVLVEGCLSRAQGKQNTFSCPFSQTPPKQINESKSRPIFKKLLRQALPLASVLSV
uniref:Secreted protein n=1 Tax=Falco tinnunculus TaxID=100819 RepID=A0A8C4UGH2_FALTI